MEHTEITALVGLFLAALGTAAAFIWNRVVAARLTQLEAEVRELRAELRERDRLLLNHAPWDAQVKASLQRLGEDVPPPPPLIPPARPTS